MKPKSKNLKAKNSTGFVVLFTVLLTSIILAIVIGASGIAYKEIVLASAAKESNYAFYAADTGLECALYWDISQDVFGANIANVSSIQCDGIPATLTSNANPFSFTLSLDNGKSCANVNVDKAVSVTVGPVDSANNTSTATQITSLGYNVSCSQLLAAGYDKIVERAEGVMYPNQ